MRVDPRFGNFFGIEFTSPLERFLNLTRGYTVVIDWNIENPFLNGTNKRYPYLGEANKFKLHDLGDNNYKFSIMVPERLTNMCMTLACTKTGHPNIAPLNLFSGSSNYYEAYFEDLQKGEYRMLFGYKVIS